jgi:hypothetical protein
LKIFSTSESYRKHVEREHFLELHSNEQNSSAVLLSNRLYGENRDDNEHESNDDNMACENIDIAQFVQIFSKQLLMFALRVREQHLLAKSTYSAIVGSMVSLFGTFQKQFSEVIVSHLEAMDVDTTVDPTLHNMLTDESMVESVWNRMKSDAKLKRFCKDELNLIESISVELGVNDVGKKETYQYVSIIKTLEHYVSHADVWQSINRMQLKNDDVLTSYADGLLFKTHEFWSQHPNALRLHFYIDDLELCNPLGGAKKKHAITAVYFQVGNVEQKHLSSLRSIHVACICNSLVAKKYGLHTIFNKIIEDITFLQETGIDVTVDGRTYRMFGSLATISADNLACHEIGGFRRCFSSGRICRHCMATYDNMELTVSEIQNGFPNLRTPATHKIHVEHVTNDPSQTSLYGVEKSNALSKLSTFCPITCLPPDCMHDVLEGLVPIVLKVCLRGCIQEKLFNVSVINDRLRRFAFGRNDAKNKPPLLSASFPNSNIVGSASQKWCLLRCLSFVIGDLIPEGNKFWELYILCRQITDIIFAPQVSLSQIQYLDVLIANHHQLLLKLAPNDFTPKCHFVTHYPRMMYLFGPLRHMWCMRFEGYHQYLKSIAKHTGNFKNICLTLADRNQMKKCYEQAGEYCLLPEEVSDCEQNKISVRSLPLPLQEQVMKYFSCSRYSQVNNVKAATLEAVHYSINSCLILDFSYNMPVFVEITHILSFDGLWALAGRIITCERFSSHYYAYFVNRHSEWVVIRPGTEKCFQLLDIYDFEAAPTRLAIHLKHSVIMTD